MEFKKRKLEITFEEKKHQLSFPTVRQMEDFSKSFSTVKPEEQLSITINLLNELGLPSDVSYSMEPDHLREIIEVISGQKKS